MSKQAEQLQAVLDGLLANETYNPIIREIAKELHDGFEVIMCETITSNPGEQVDGLAILAVLMAWTRQIQTYQGVSPRVTAPRGLPSQRHGNSSPTNSSADF